MLHATSGYLWKALIEYRCTDLRLFGASVWKKKLLIIEPFSQQKLNKIKTEKCIGIWGAFLVLLESPWQVRFNRLYFTIFRAKV
jgi:hypothetical protein